MSPERMQERGERRPLRPGLRGPARHGVDARRHPRCIWRREGCRPTLWNGVVSGAFIWLGFVITTMVVNYAFHGARQCADPDRRRPLARRAADPGRFVGGAVVAAIRSGLPRAINRPALESAPFSRPCASTPLLTSFALSLFARASKRCVCDYDARGPMGVSMGRIHVRQNRSWLGNSEELAGRSSSCIPSCSCCPFSPASHSLLLMAAIGLLGVRRSRRATTSAT